MKSKPLIYKGHAFDSHGEAYAFELFSEILRLPTKVHPIDNRVPSLRVPDLSVALIPGKICYVEFKGRSKQFGVREINDWWKHLAEIERTIPVDLLETSPTKPTLNYLLINEDFDLWAWGIWQPNEDSGRWCLQLRFYKASNPELQNHWKDAKFHVWSRCRCSSCANSRKNNSSILK